jgi:cell division initiation protein
MKITPIEIRQKSFDLVFRGYDREEVNAFLQSLSQEWERVIDENKENRIKLEVAEKEVKKLREVENSLYRTLKTAEETGTHLVEQANKSAELYVKEARAHAEALLRDARNKANAMLHEAESLSKRTLEDAMSELKNLERDFRQLGNHKENIALEIKSMLTDVMEKVSRVEARSSRFSFEDKIKEIRTTLEQKNDALTSISSSLEAPSLPESFSAGTTLNLDIAKPIEPSRIEELQPEAEKPADKPTELPLRKPTSFFDELE